MTMTEEELQKRSLPIIMELLDRAGIAAESHSRSTRSPDVLIRIPSHGVTLVIEVKRNLHPAKVQPLTASLFQQHPNSIPVVGTSRLTRKTFEECCKHGLCAIDMDKNGSLRLPGFYLERFVEQHGPKRTKPTSGTAFTAKASRIVRAILNSPNHSWSQKELIDETGTSQGYVSRTLGLLADEGYLYTLGGLTRLTEFDRLLDDWVSHYRFDRHEKHMSAMSFNTYEQGLQKLTVDLHRQHIDYALTGWSGAFLRAPYGTSETLMAYVSELPSEHSTIFPVNEGGNVVLYLPQDEGVMQFPSTPQGFRVVSDVQLYLDLARMPGRAKEQAQKLRETRLNHGEQR